MSVNPSKAIQGLLKSTWALLRGPFARPQFARALRYPSQGWLRFRSLFGLSFAVVGLLALGYLVGHGPLGTKGGFWYSETTAVTDPVVVAVLALLAVMLGGWCVRRLWLEYLASTLVKIQVTDFTNPSELHGVSPTHLTTQFRNRLATLSLRSDSVAPGAVPPSDFLNVLSENSSDSSVGQVVSFLRASFPSTALIVGGTLLERDYASKERFGVSLQVTRMPDQGSVLEDVWDTSWECAVRRAADAATAAILPRTRFCRGTWVAWRGYVMPPELLSAYEDALELESERRYYAALESCYRALRHDPLNRAVRLQLGKVQEQLGLFVDALGTYEGIVMAARPAGGPLPKGLYRRRARLERARMEHIARYRLIVLLGGRSIVRQWEYLGTHEDSRRREDVKAFLLRTCDLPRAIQKRRRAREREIRADGRSEVRAARATFSCITEGRRACRREAVATAKAKLERELRRARAERQNRLDSLLTMLSAGQLGRGVSEEQIAARARSRRELCVLLAESARGWVDDLCRDLRRWHLVHPRGKAHLLVATVALAGACIDERIAILLDGLAPPEERLASLSAVERRELLDRRVADCARRSGLRSWQNHYNAACLYAISLEEDETLDANHERLLAVQAVKHLALGASFADSAFLAGRQDWLISEDPDLVRLRCRAEFVRFISMYFPNTGVRQTRPKRAEELAAARYMRELLRDMALGWAMAWQQRSKALRAGYDWRDLLQWWREEGEVWKTLKGVAGGAREWREYVSLDWRRHVEVVSAQRSWRVHHGVEFPVTRFLRYEDKPFECDVGSRDAAAEAEIIRIESRLRLVPRVLQSDNDPSPPSAFDRPEAWLPLSLEDVTRMCQSRSLLWEWVSRWLESELMEERELDESLLRAIKQVREHEPWLGVGPVVGGV